MQKELPEEKLLNVIRKDQLASTASSSLAKKKHFLIFDLKFLKNIFSYKQLIALLVIASLGLSLFIFSLILWNPITELGSSETTRDFEVLSETISVSTLDELDNYVKLATEKNIFKLVKESGIKGAVGTAVEELLLLGIVTEEPKQAIIKELSSGNTFFLEIGDNLSGMKIKDIQEGLVTLEIDGEISELYL